MIKSANGNEVFELMTQAGLSKVILWIVLSSEVGAPLST